MSGVSVFVTKYIKVIIKSSDKLIGKNYFSRQIYRKQDTLRSDYLH